MTKERDNRLWDLFSDENGGLVAHLTGSEISEGDRKNLSFISGGQTTSDIWEEAENQAQIPAFVE